MTMINSYKQMLRRPGKALLFFLLMGCAAAMLTFGAGLYYISASKLQDAESMYTTIGTISQPKSVSEYLNFEDPCCGTVVEPLERYDNNIMPGSLVFSGANYIHAPESRPYYVACMPERNQYLQYRKNQTGDIAEFVPLEDPNEGEPVKVRISKVLFHGNHLSRARANGFAAVGETENLDQGRELYLCQHLAAAIPLEKGKTYIGNIVLHNAWHGCEAHDRIIEFELSYGPYSSQFDSNGKMMDSPLTGMDNRRYAEEVTEDFYEPGGHGERWLELCKQSGIQDHIFPVMATNSLNLIPSYRQSKVDVHWGRGITEEEFNAGAKVCMISSNFASKNLLYEGDKITLPLLCGLYGIENEATGLYMQEEHFSLLDAEGRLYEPFWEEEYEIVGIFMSGTAPKDFKYDDLIVIPQRSILAKDENIAMYRPMNAVMSSFQIPNGSIEEFDKALHGSIPEADVLSIAYDDMGYTELAANVRDAQKQALLLLWGGGLAALTIIALLLFFFVVREEKRIAIERSLGMSSAQCKISIMAAIMGLTVLSTAVGGIAGTVLLNNSSAFGRSEVIENIEQINSSELNALDDPGRWGLGGNFDFSVKHSPWAMWDAKGNQIKSDSTTLPGGILIMGPVSLCLIVLVGGLVVIQKNINADPLTMLGTK